MYGRDNSPCRVCGDTNDPCLCSYYSDKTLFKELERRGYIITASKNDIEVEIKEKEVTIKYQTEVKNAK